MAAPAQLTAQMTTKQKLEMLTAMNLPNNVIKLIAQCLNFHKTHDVDGAELSMRRAEQAMVSAGLELDARMAVVYEIHASVRDASRDVASQIELLTKGLELLGAPDLPPHMVNTKIRLLKQRGLAFGLSSRQVEENHDYEMAEALATDDVDRIQILLKLMSGYGGLADPRAKVKQLEFSRKLEAALRAYELHHPGRHSSPTVDLAWETLLGFKHYEAKAAGNSEEALLYAQEYVAHMTEAGAEAGARSLLAAYLWSLGQRAEALEHMAKTDALFARAKLGMKLPAYFMQCVDAWLLMGVPSKALLLVDRMEQVLKATTPAQQQTHMLHAAANARARAHAMTGNADELRGQQEEADKLRRRIWNKCSVDSCKNSFQANAEKLMVCGTCKQAWYCSKDCQLADWKAKHKIECKKWKENLTAGGNAGHAGAPC